MASGVGLSTGIMYDPYFRNSFQKDTGSALFTPTSEQEKTIGPTRENLAYKAHQESIDNLAVEVAAKETPQATAEREEKGYFAKKAEERELQAQKDELKKKVEDNMLENAVKLDPYFLVKSDWDRKVIMAANGETVVVQIETKELNKDGTYVVKDVEITKSSKLQKLADLKQPGKPQGKTVAQIESQASKKRSALMDKYEDAEDGNRVVFSLTGRIVGGSSVAIEAYKNELKEVDEWEAREKSILLKQAQAVPAPQGKNIEPHTIAIFAPGYCMEEGCCLENAYYTLRATAKKIEDDSELLAKEELKDRYESIQSQTDEIQRMQNDINDIDKKLQEEATRLGIAAYNEAYKQATTYYRDPSGKVIMSTTPKPEPKDYQPDMYMQAAEEANPDLVMEREDLYMQMDEAEMELEAYKEETQEEYDKAVERLTTEAKNYRLLLEKCSFQPTCPEWLEDLGTGTVELAKKAGEAVVNAAEWVWTNGTEAISWVSDKANAGLAYLGDLQDTLNEYIGFKGICQLNPFGGTLGCSNCPMGANCESKQASLLDKIKRATVENQFLTNLKRALGLGKGQLLGNLLQCAAALSGNILGVADKVGGFAIASGMPGVLGQAATIAGDNGLPHMSTKVADCVSNITGVTQAKEAAQLLQSVGKSPMSIMQDNVPGLDIKGVDFGKIDQLNTTTKAYTNTVLGTDKSDLLATAKQALPVEKPSGSTKYYDGKNVDPDVAAASKSYKEQKAAGITGGYTNMPTTPSSAQ